MKIYSVQEAAQGSPEWHELHRGRPTASDFDKILTPKTRKPSASQGPFICFLIASRSSYNPGWFSESRNKPPNQAMQYGLDVEPEARSWYELQCDLDVSEVGFIETDDGRFGCSPDGVLGLDCDPEGNYRIEGLLELKCPQPDTHLRYLLEGGLDDDYRCQVHGQLIVTGARFVDLVSYSRDYEPVKIRVEPDDFTVALRAELERFWEKYALALARVKNKAATV